MRRQRQNGPSEFLQLSTCKIRSPILWISSPSDKLACQKIPFILHLTKFHTICPAFGDGIRGIGSSLDFFRRI